MELKILWAWYGVDRLGRWVGLMWMGISKRCKKQAFKLAVVRDMMSFLMGDKCHSLWLPDYVYVGVEVGKNIVTVKTATTRILVFGAGHSRYQAEDQALLLGCGQASHLCEQGPACKLVRDLTWEGGKENSQRNTEQQEYKSGIASKHLECVHEPRRHGPRRILAPSSLERVSYYTFEVEMTNLAILDYKPRRSSRYLRLPISSLC